MYSIKMDIPLRTVKVIKYIMYKSIFTVSSKNDAVGKFKIEKNLHLFNKYGYSIKKLKVV